MEDFIYLFQSDCLGIVFEVIGQHDSVIIDVYCFYKIVDDLFLKLDASDVTVFEPLHPVKNHISRQIWHLHFLLYDLRFQFRLFRFQFLHSGFYRFIVKPFLHCIQQIGTRELVFLQPLSQGGEELIAFLLRRNHHIRGTVDAGFGKRMIDRKLDDSIFDRIFPNSFFLAALSALCIRAFVIVVGFACSAWPTFIQQLEAKGYTFDYTRFSVKAENWQRGIRLNRLGFTDDVMYERWDQNEADPEFRYRYQNHKPRISDSAVLITTVVEMKYRKRARTPLNVLYQQDEYERTHPPKQPHSEIDKYLDGLVYEMNHTNDTVTILVDAIFAILIALIDLASHYTREVILSADLRHELQDYAQFCSDHRFLKENKLHTPDDLDRDIEQTKAQISALETKRGKVRNQIRHETDPTVLVENKEHRAAITAEITALRNRVKRVKRIQKDAPRLLNLLKMELQHEYERKHPVKEQQRQRARSHEQER